MSVRRGRPDSHPLLRIIGLVGALIVAGLVMDAFGRVLEAVCREVFR